MKRRTVIGLMASTAALASAAPARAEAFPSRPIRLVVGFPPGAQTDLTARLVAQALEEAIGMTVVVENRAGASGAIAATLVARSTADGYTLLLSGNGNLTLAPLTNSNVTYDTLRDFTPLALVSRLPWILAVRAQLQAATAADLIGEVRRNPGKFTFAATGESTRLAAEQLQAIERSRMVIVPYKGTSPALLDVAAGRVDMLFTDPAAMKPYLASGAIRPLAVTSSERSPAMPQLPTMTEQGVKDFVWGSWQAVMAPRDTPPAVVTLLRSSLRQAVNSRTFLSGLARLGFEPVPDGATDFTPFLRQEIERFRQIISTISPGSS